MLRCPCTRQSGLGLLLLLAGTLGCERVEDDLLRVSPPPRLAAESQLPARPLNLVPAPGSLVQVTLRGTASETHVELSSVRGSITLPPLNLRLLRGELRVNLDDLNVTSGPVEAGALLELLLPTTGPNEKHSARGRIARFSIREVLSADPGALHLAPAKLTGGALVLEAHVVVRGDLELAGIRSELDVELQLTCPAADAGPDLKRLTLRTIGAIELPLAVHGLLAPRPANRSPIDDTAGPDAPFAALLRSGQARLLLPLLATEQ